MDKITINTRWLVEISDGNLAKDDTNRVIILFPSGLFILLKPSFIESTGIRYLSRSKWKDLTCSRGETNETSFAEARRGATKWWWRRRRRRDEIREDACIPSRLLVSSDCFASIRWCLYRYHVPSTRSLIPEGTPNKWNGALVLPPLPFHTISIRLFVYILVPLIFCIDIFSEIHFNYTFCRIINLRIEKN